VVASGQRGQAKEYVSGFYSQYILARFYDCLMDKPIWAKYRKEQLADVDGEILEIGIGTGLNLSYYSDHVRKITTVGPNFGMNRKLRKRLQQTGIEVRKHIISIVGAKMGSMCNLIPRQRSNVTNCTRAVGKSFGLEAETLQHRNEEV